MVWSVIEAEVDYLPLPAPGPEQCSWPDKNKHGSTTTTVVAGLEVDNIRKSIGKVCRWCCWNIGSIITWYSSHNG